MQLKHPLYSTFAVRKVSGLRQRAEAQAKVECYSEGLGWRALPPLGLPRMRCAVVAGRRIDLRRDGSRLVHISLHSYIIYKEHTLS